MAEKIIFSAIKYPKASTAAEAALVLNEITLENLGKLKDAVSITKTEKGYIKLHPTARDVTQSGFLKDGLACVVLTLLFGPTEWLARGETVGSTLAAFNPVIKNLLVTELGEKMSVDESAVVFMIQSANWRKAVGRMAEHQFGGRFVIAQNVEVDLSDIEKILENEELVSSIPLFLSLEGLPIDLGEEMAEAEEAEAAVVAAEALAEDTETPVEAPVEAPAAPLPRKPSKLEYLEGVGPVYAHKLEEAGVVDVKDLLNKGSTPKGRQMLVEATGISSKRILRWVNMCDLYRIKGIGSEYAELLEAAGVDTVVELSHRVPANLLEMMLAANARRKMVRRPPVLSMVQSWVEQAKSLPRVVTY
jgi:predicted flap endonuclease-1-like 5' DNA nuclease/uncharacterized membrane protein